MSVNADWRTFTLVAPFDLSLLLSIASGIARLLGKPFATLWLASLARFALVFFLAFTLLSIGAMVAPTGLEPLGLHGLARRIDEPELAFCWAALAAVAAYAAFWDRFHRPEGGTKG